MMNDEYMPAPSRKALTLVVQAPRMRIIVMSIRGSGLDVSTTTQAQQIAKPAARSASVRGDAQPHVVASLIASNSDETPVLISRTASQLTRPPTRTGDSGTRRQVPTA